MRDNDTYLKRQIGVREFNLWFGARQRSIRITRHDLDQINLGRSASLEWMHAVMVLTVAGRECLCVLQFAVARVVTPGPNVVGAGQIGRASQIAHHPDGRPQATNVGVARKDHVDFDNAAGETKLVPGLHHARREIGLFVLPHFVDVIVPRPSRLFEVGRNLEKAILGRDGRGIVKLHGTATRRTGVVVGTIEGRPHGVVAIAKGAIVHIELIRHDLEVCCVSQRKRLCCLCVNLPNDRRCHR